ncbi:cytochrome ubiquinol oxidase subunit I [Amorphus orientalis]|uniref:Cytochrome d ubiquinol oxidase subunit I n=1 Tax=Amorphus orientalis TaxID=649198 RepID=A0AAE3VPY2_9HYPH|nr:cytochrome ubiquinol oxidase subunit I [Amorphus orientalis]MDQ0315640.1 cytochrome d ubiquinol oxidase subunit I [Amorphus orientalis]
MDFDPVLLSRIQFAFTVTFHIIFPSFTIGLAAWIATLEGMWLWSKNERYHKLARFWTKIFAVSFGMGVVSGVVLSYQFGTNWSEYSRVVGNVVAPLIGYEVLTAFFLEATFLGIMLFGWNRVPPWLHFTASVLVALGTAMSAFWILSANSWMQYPVGYSMQNGVAVPEDWLEIIFSPTFPTRFAHMLTAAYITTAFVVLAAGARYWLQGRHIDHAETMIKMALGLLIVLVPLQMEFGDQSGMKVAEYQPTKVAAMEAHWDGNESPVPFVLFAWPNEETESNDFAITIPHVASMLITRTWDGKFPGLKDVPAEDRPPVAPVFFSFRIMVGLGLIMLATVVVGAVLWWRRRLFSTGLYLKTVSYMWPIGFLAIVAGWYTTEIGRQPWVVHGVLRTADAVSPVPGGSVATTLALFVIVYGIVFSFGIYYINRLLRRGPEPTGEGSSESSARRPISFAHDAGRDAIQPGE